MSAALQIDISYEQVLALVRQLPFTEKILLSKELEKDGIKSTLAKLLNTFKTDELSLDVINQEVEIVRQQLYNGKK